VKRGIFFAGCAVLLITAIAFVQRGESILEGDRSAKNASMTAIKARVGEGQGTSTSSAPPNAVTHDTTTRPRAPSPSCVGVEEMMRNVDRFRGGVQVQGVVNGVSAERRVFSLIDSREAAECDLACPELVLPVRWEGSMPEVRETIRVEGIVEETDGAFIFAARSVDKIRP
jgi:hypothetical protein